MPRRTEDPLPKSGFPGAALLAWYRRHRRKLPWREAPLPYRVWVSEVMLQQTRVETVIPYYNRFLERFPTLSDLARAPLEDVLSLWSGLGYYRRARSLHEGVRVVLDHHGGKFPRKLKDALAIPGVGPYTAAAVLSIAYSLPVPVVDGNVERVLTRFLRLPGNPKASRTARKLHETAAEFMPDGHASDFNQALMELGATVCTPTGPDCEACPLEANCLAARQGDALRFPEKPAARATVAVAMEAAVLCNEGRFLIERRKDGALLGGLWMFPLIEIAKQARRERSGKPGSRPSRRLVDLVERELASKVTGAKLLGEVRHSVTYRRLRVRVFSLRPESPGLQRARPQDLRWVRLQDLGERLPVPSLALKIARLAKNFKRPS